MCLASTKLKEGDTKNQQTTFVQHVCDLNPHRNTTLAPPFLATLKAALISGGRSADRRTLGGQIGCDVRVQLAHLCAIAREPQKNGVAIIGSS